MRDRLLGACCLLGTLVRSTNWSRVGSLKKVRVGASESDVAAQARGRTKKNRGALFVFVIGTWDSLLLRSRGFCARSSTAVSKRASSHTRLFFSNTHTRTHSHRINLAFERCSHSRTQTSTDDELRALRAA